MGDRFYILCRTFQVANVFISYAVGAFINFGLAEVEEMTLEFNLKLAGKSGLPALAEGLAEAPSRLRSGASFLEPLYNLKAGTGNRTPIISLEG